MPMKTPDGFDPDKPLSEQVEFNIPSFQELREKISSAYEENASNVDANSIKGYWKNLYHANRTPILVGSVVVGVGALQYLGVKKLLAQHETTTVYVPYYTDVAPLVKDIVEQLNTP